MTRRSHRERALLVGTISCLQLLAMACERDSSGEATRAFIEDVCLGVEYGDDEAICHRWIVSPTLSVFGADATQDDVIDTVLAEINCALDGTDIKIARVDDHAEEATIKVIYSPLAEFEDLATQNGFSYHPGNWGYFWVFWNERKEIYRATILLASDRLEGKRLKHFTLEEITQSLGLCNDSPLIEESIFFASGRDGGKATELAPDDVRLIKLFYTHVKPGDDRRKVRELFDTHWPNL